MKTKEDSGELLYCPWRGGRWVYNGEKRIVSAEVTHSFIKYSFADDKCIFYVTANRSGNARGGDDNSCWIKIKEEDEVESIFYFKLEHKSGSEIDHTEYGNVTITKFEYGKIPVTGGTVQPIVLANQLVTDVYTDGTTVQRTMLVTKFSYIKLDGSATLNTNGSVSYENENTQTSEINVATIKVTATGLNLKVATSTANVFLLGAQPVTFTVNEGNRIISSERQDVLFTFTTSGTKPGDKIKYQKNQEGKITASNLNSVYVTYYENKSSNPVNDTYKFWLVRDDEVLVGPITRTIEQQGHVNYPVAYYGVCTGAPESVDDIEGRTGNYGSTRVVLTGNSYTTPALRVSDAQKQNCCWIACPTGWSLTHWYDNLHTDLTTLTNAFRELVEDEPYGTTKQTIGNYTVYRDYISFAFNQIFTIQINK